MSSPIQTVHAKNIICRTSLKLMDTENHFFFLKGYLVPYLLKDRQAVIPLGKIEPETRLCKPHHDNFSTLLGQVYPDLLSEIHFWKWLWLLMLFGGEILGCKSKWNDDILNYKIFKPSLYWEENKNRQWYSHNVDLITCWTTDSQMSSFAIEHIEKLRFHAFL